MIRFINRVINGESGVELHDDSDALTPAIVASVHAALKGGLREFITLDEENRRIHWAVKHLALPPKAEGKEPRVYLIAYDQTNAHFELLGPETAVSHKAAAAAPQATPATPPPPPAPPPAPTPPAAPPPEPTPEKQPLPNVLREKPPEPKPPEPTKHDKQKARR